MTAGEMEGRADPALGVESNNSPGLGNCCPSRLQHAVLPPTSETGAWCGAELQGAGSSPSPSCWGGQQGGYPGGRHGDLLWDVAAVSRGGGQDPSWGFKGNLKTTVSWWYKG